MHIDIIKEIHQFENLKEAWDEVYLADPNTTIFQSWSWLRGWLETNDDPWHILCFRPEKSSSYFVGFLPLTIEAKSSYFSQQKMKMWGGLSADHATFICHPDYEDSILEAAAVYIQNAKDWNRFELKQILDERLDAFLRYFTVPRYSVQELENTPCPFIPLPTTWEDYLKNCLNSKRRRNLKRYSKKLKNRTKFLLTSHEDGDFENQVKTIRKLWEAKWGTPRHDVSRFFHVYKYCFAANRLWINIFWDDINPIGGVISFVDRDKKVFHPYTMGYDSKYNKLSPGTVIIGNSIKSAIEDGFLMYSFGRGGLEYKQSTFGASPRFNRNVLIERKNIKTSINKIRGRALRFIRDVF